MNTIFGESLVVVPDLDQGGVQDLLIGSHGPGLVVGRKTWLVPGETLTLGSLPLLDVGSPFMEDQTGAGYNVVAAGDLNKDGYQDLWRHTQGYFGPFTTPILKTDHADIDFKGLLAGGGTIGNVDLDDDGELDVIFAGFDRDAQVYFGPFPTGDVALLPSPDAPPWTWLPPNGTYAQPAIWDYGSVSYEGQHAYSCGHQTGYEDGVNVYDLGGPPRGTLDPDEARLFWTEGNPVPCHLDLDGLTDQVAGTGVHWSVASGYLSFFTVEPWAEPDWTRSWVTCVDDLTGDGIDELFFQDIYNLTSMWIVRPDLAHLPVEEAGIELLWPSATVGIYHSHLGWPEVIWGDLDNDGLAELVAADPNWNDIGRVLIWSGADIRALFDARGLLTEEGP